MYVVILILHILVAVVLMAVVLMQSGKGRGLAGTFGGGGNQTLFGGRGAVDFLGKATWGLGGLFMLTSLTLAVLSSHRGSGGGAGGSVIPKDPVPMGAPAIPGAPTPSEPAPIPSEGAPEAPAPGGN